MSQRWIIRHAVGLAVLAGISASGALAAESEAPSRPKVEFTLGSWLFTTGQTVWSHNASGLDPRLGNPTSKLTYKDNNTHILELGARVNLTQRLYVQGDFGASVALNRGSLIDDDYSAVGGQHLWSRTSSDITGSGTQYVNLNVGYRVKEFEGNRGFVDIFGGLQYWRTKYEATGVQQVVCTPSGIPGVACTPNLNLTGVVAITNTTHWITPTNVGLQTEYRFNRRVSVGFKGSVSPLSVVYNEDVHHLRSDLQQNPSFSMLGLGFATNGEATVKVALAQNLWIAGGYRGWLNQAYTGTWKNYPVGSPSDTAPLKEFQTFRHGATLALTAAF